MGYQMVTWPMTSRDPQRYCDAVRSTILATAWLLVFITTSHLKPRVLMTIATLAFRFRFGIWLLHLRPLWMDLTERVTVSLSVGGRFLWLISQTILPDYRAVCNLSPRRIQVASHARGLAALSVVLAAIRGKYLFDLIRFDTVPFIAQINSMSYRPPMVLWWFYNAHLPSSRRFKFSAFKVMLFLNQKVHRPRGHFASI